MRQVSLMRLSWKTAVLLALAAISARAPAAEVVLDQSCTISILNRTVQVAADGSWSLPNVPSTMGQIRARAACIRDGTTVSGQSDYFIVQNNSTVSVPQIEFGQAAPIPTALLVPITTNQLAGVGATLPLVVFAHYADGSLVDVSSGRPGINYVSSNPRIASVNGDVLVMAVSSGSVVVTARLDGATAIFPIVVNAGGDADGDIAFVAAGTAGLVIVDASDAAAPQIVTTVDTDGNALRALQARHAGRRHGVDRCDLADRPGRQGLSA